MLEHRVEEESVANWLSAERSEEQQLEQILRPYGIGVDCHSRFYAICVLIRHEEKVLRH